MRTPTRTSRLEPAQSPRGSCPSLSCPRRSRDEGGSLKDKRAIVGISEARRRAAAAAAGRRPSRHWTKHAWHPGRAPPQNPKSSIKMRSPDKPSARSTINSWLNRMWQKFFLLLRKATMSPQGPKTSLMTSSPAFSGSPPTNTVLQPGGRGRVDGGGSSWETSAWAFVTTGGAPFKCSDNGCAIGADLRRDVLTGVLREERASAAADDLLDAGGVTRRRRRGLRASADQLGG